MIIFPFESEGTLIILNAEVEDLGHVCAREDQLHPWCPLQVPMGPVDSTSLSDWDAKTTNNIIYININIIKLQKYP